MTRAARAPQLDLALEARHLARFNRNFRSWRNLSFPSPIFPLVAPDVLVETFEQVRPGGPRSGGAPSLPPWPRAESHGCHLRAVPVPGMLPSGQRRRIRRAREISSQSLSVAAGASACARVWLCCSRHALDVRARARLITYPDRAGPADLHVRQQPREPVQQGGRQPGPELLPEDAAERQLHPRRPAPRCARASLHPGAPAPRAGAPGPAVRARLRTGCMQARRCSAAQACLSIDTQSWLAAWGGPPGACGRGAAPRALRLRAP